MGRDYWSWGRSFRKPSPASGTPGKYKHSAAAAPAGCLSGALQVFDLHRLLFTAARSTSGASLSPEREHHGDSEAADLLKGVEAPRNSLELDPVGVAAAASVAGHAASGSDDLRHVAFEDEDFEIPFAIHVAPRSVGGSQAASCWSSPLPLAEDPRSSQCLSHGSSSNSGRSGNVVARLMGLDLLPDQAASPRTCYANRDALLSPPPPARDRSRLRRVSKQQEHHQQHYPQAAAIVTPRIPLQPRRNCNVSAVDDMRHGTRSLPDTPRMSASSARPSWDSETPRHSLQSHIGAWNKENMSASAIRELKSICEDYSTLEPSPPRPLKVCVKAARAKENCPPKEIKSSSGVSAVIMSPRRYAREIVRQAKDSVARRISGSSAAGSDGDEAAAPVVKSERRLRASASFLAADKGSKEANCLASPRCSPRSRTQAEEVEISARHNNNIQGLPNQDVAKQQRVQERCEPSSKPQQVVPQGTLVTSGLATTCAPTPSSSSLNTIKKASYERFMTERLKKPATSPAATPPRREARIAPPAATTPQQRMRTCMMRPGSRIQIAPRAAALAARHNLKNTDHAAVSAESDSPPPPHRPSRSPPPPAALEEESESDPDEKEELRYVKCVLEKAGIMPNVPVPQFLRWYSPSHPLDPAIFHHLELSSCSISPRAGPLQQRCNRKLLFHLVDELLSDIFWPRLQDEPVLPTTTFSAGAAIAAFSRPMMTGDALVRRVWSQARSYPGADCHVIQDIDALVEMDLTGGNVRGILRHPAVAEEAACVAAELEVVLMDALLTDATEAAAEGGCHRWRQQRDSLPLPWSPRVGAYRSGGPWSWVVGERR